MRFHHLRDAAASHTRKLLNLLLPGLCHLCGGASSMPLCNQCYLELPLNNGPRCQICDIGLKNEAPLCGECLRHQPTFRHIRAVWLYEGEIPNLLTRFKDGFEPSWVKMMAEPLMKELERQSPLLPDVLVPVPLHWTRRLARGYNQSEIIARLIGKRFGIPVRRALKKVKRGQTQKTLGRKARLKNLQLSFSVCESVRDKNIALIDDVVTSGSTAETASKILINAGAKEVIVWALARTPKTGKIHSR